MHVFSLFIASCIIFKINLHHKQSKNKFGWENSMTSNRNVYKIAGPNVLLFWEYIFNQNIFEKRLFHENYDQTFEADNHLYKA